MIFIKAIRLILCEEKTFFQSPIIKTYQTEKGAYKKVLRKLKQEEYDVVTLKEYNKKIVEYCQKLGVLRSRVLLSATALGTGMSCKIHEISHKAL